MIERLVDLAAALAALIVISLCWLVPGDPAAAPNLIRLTSTTAGEGVPTPPATSSPIPISPAGSLGQFNLSSSSYAIARRFVVTEDTTIDRWYFAINGEGADCVGGRRGYGAGDGGTYLGRIMAVDQDTGLPTETLAFEEVNACDAYERAMTEFNLKARHQAQYVQFASVTLQAERMYAFVLINMDPDPGDAGGDSTGNHMSPNLDFARLDDMGPQGRNTLDAAAPGAAYGVDPRETTMWSEDSGETWEFGDEVGWYGKHDGYGGMWPGGYRIAGDGNVAHGWSYMNWPEEGPASVLYTAAADGVLIAAGGASSEDDVGVVTVKNLDTGLSATTADLGTGLVSSALNRPVPIAKGQVYGVSTEGDVDTGSADPWDRIFGASLTGRNQDVSSCPDCRAKADRPMLFASMEVQRPGTGGNAGGSMLPTVIVAAAVALAALVGLVLLIRRRRSTQ